MNCGDGALTVQATAAAADSTVARMARLVEEARPSLALLRCFVLAPVLALKSVWQFFLSWCTLLLMAGSLQLLMAPLIKSSMSINFHVHVRDNNITACPVGKASFIVPSCILTYCSWAGGSLCCCCLTFTYEAALSLISCARSALMSALFFLTTSCVASEQATSRQSPMETFVVRFAKWYTPIVVAACLCLALIPLAARVDDPKVCRGS